MDGSVPRRSLDALDSEVHHIRDDQRKASGKFEAVESRLRAVEITVGHLDRTAKFWLPIVGALMVAVLTAVIVK